MNNLSDEQLVNEVAVQIENFRQEFTERLSPIEQTTRTRLVRIFEVWKQANLRRVVDLADAALSLFRGERLVPACTLTRAAFETVGVAYYVHKKRPSYTRASDPESIHNLLISAVFGRKDLPDSKAPIQILTEIDHMDREFAGLRSEYDHLCEYAHPNLKGGFATYVHQVGENSESHLGNNPQSLDMGTWGLGSLQSILTTGDEVNQRLKAFRTEFVVMAEKHAPNGPL